MQALRRQGDLLVPLQWCVIGGLLGADRGLAVLLRERPRLSGTKRDG